MSNKPKALLIADELENGDTYESHSRPVYGWECRSGDPCQDAADELRRLHALNAQILEALRGCIDEAEHIGTDGWMTGGMHSDEYKAAVAAIAAAAGGES